MSEYVPCEPVVLVPRSLGHVPILPCRCMAGQPSPSVPRAGDHCSLPASEDRAAAIREQRPEKVAPLLG